MHDAFDVLDLTPSFDVDLAELDRRQRQLLAALHPARQAAAAARNDASYTQQGEINNAARQLRNPVTRAELLLRRSNQAATPCDSSELLARMFAEREVLENAIIARDRPTLSNCVGAALSRQVALLQVLTAHFRAAPKSSGLLTVDIGSVLEELQYVSKLIKRGEQALDDLE